MNRADLELELCRQALQPGHFDELPQRVRDELVQRIRAQLAHYSLEFLQEAAGPGPNRPSILLDEALRVSFAQPTEADAEDPAVLEAKLMAEANQQGLLFHGYDPDGLPIITSMDQLNTHMAVVGTSGTGKSTQLARYFTQLAQRGGPMILIDPHGTLIQEILPRLPAHRRKDVVYITPNDTKRSWGINLLQVGRKLRASRSEELDPDVLENVLETTVQTIVQALAQIQEDESGLAAGISIQSTLQMFAQAAAEYPEASFVDVYQIATSRKIQGLVKASIRNPIVRQYFQDTLPELRVEYLERVRNKLQKFVSSSAMLNLFSRRQEGRDLRSLIDEDKILLFDLNRKNGLPYQVSNLIGFIVVTLVMLVVDHRQPAPGEKLKPFYMLIDEFQNVASKSTVRWLTEARKQSASLIVAFQHLHQLSEDVRNALGNASTWAVFRSTPQDARFLAPLLGLSNAAKADIGELVEVPQFEMRLRYDEEDVQAETRPMKRSLVTVKAPPLAPPPRNAAQIVEAILDYSSKRYTMPTNPADRETILAASDTGTIDVLQAIHEACMALEPGSKYLWPKGMDSTAKWAVDNRLATSNLVQEVLKAKGLSLTSQRFDGLKEALIRRRLVVAANTPAGYKHLCVEKKGIDELRGYVNPGTSANEGEQKHRDTVLLSFLALARLAPMRIIVPVQQTDKPTPDLIVDNEPDTYLRRITTRKFAHLEIEISTSTQVQALLDKVERAHDVEAYPIFVLPDSEDPLKDARELYQRIHNALTGNNTGHVSTGMRAHFTKNRDHLYGVWVVTADARIIAYERLLGTMLPVDGAYKAVAQAQDAAKPPQAQPSPARAAFEAIIQDKIMDHQTWVKRDEVKAKLAERGFRGLADNALDEWAREKHLTVIFSPMGDRYRLT